MNATVASALLTLLCAELFLLLCRVDQLKIAIKSDAQLSGEERKRISRGLRRDLLFDFLIFVPVNFILASIIFRTAFLRYCTRWMPGEGPTILVSLKQKDVACSGLFGLVFCGFPWATIKRKLIGTFLSVLHDWQVHTDGGTGENQ